MYPVADMHLGRFLEHVDDLDITETVEPRRFLSRALGCLASTVAFIHEQTTKHMDIKPQNILVRKAKPPFRSEWRIYLADFGLSRSFSSEDHSQTDGPTARSPRYCSPEVYNDEPRGRPADIFSLGCVFLEILCVLGGLDLQDFTDARRGDGRDESFHANLERVFEWVYMKLFEVPSDLVHKPLILLVIPMLCRDPSTRPTAKFIRSNLEGFPEGWCSPKSCCSQPQEPYTTYQPIEKRNGIHIP
jgi:serine/threonine protein kinase